MAPLLPLLFACVAPQGGGADTAAPAGVTSTGGSMSSTTTTSGTTPVANSVPPDGPWTHVEPWISIVVPSTLFALAPIVGDFDGDGAADLAIASGPLVADGDAPIDLTVEFWFGSLTVGTLTVGTATTRIDGVDSLAGGDFQNTGDLDGDGADDLLLSNALLRAPERGAVATSSDMEIAHTGATYPWEMSAFGDIDGDGWIDAAVVDVVVRITYGPLAGDVTLPALEDLTGPPVNETWLVWDGACVGYSVDILPDINGDGAAEVRAGKEVIEDYASSCSGPNPHHIWSPAGARGLALTPSQALLSGLPNADLGPDFDNDGVPDLVSDVGGSQVWSTAAAVRDGALGSPVLDVPYPQIVLASNPGDLTGDGANEAFGGVAYHQELTYQSYGAVLMSPQPAGQEVDVTAAGTLLDVDLAGARSVADLTGDGVPDLLSSAMIFDGAALIEAFASRP